MRNIESSNSSLNSPFFWSFEFRSKPPSVFKIFKDNKEVKVTDRIGVEKLENSENNYALSFKNVESTDGGLYKLVATNKCGSATSSEATLNVTGGACIIRKPNPQVFVAEKKAIKVEFEVAGIPLPEVQWFKNGQIFTNEPRLKVESKKSVHILSLDNATLNDAAEFTLKAKNESGEASESFKIIIQSKFLMIS